MRSGGRRGGGVSDGGGWTEQTSEQGQAAGQAPREGSLLPIPSARNNWLERVRLTRQHEGEEKTRPYRKFRLKGDGRRPGSAAKR